jgi:DNA-binding MarR family transcriptional regulator
MYLALNVKCLTYQQERWQSGRLRYLGKVVTGQLVPGFESPSLRQFQNSSSVKANFFLFIFPMYNFIKQSYYVNMNEFYRNIFDALIMLDGLEKDLNIRHFSPNELKVFYTIVTQNALNEGDSNISEIVNCSGMSRSTVYKTLKKLSNEGIINLTQSEDDGRESLITLVGNS